jgi:hypothetical protein
MMTDEERKAFYLALPADEARGMLLMFTGMMTRVVGILECGDYWSIESRAQEMKDALLRQTA